MTNQELKDLLTEEMHRQGKTPYGIAKDTGLRIRNVYSYFHGKTLKIDFEKIYQIAKVLGVQITVKKSTKDLQK